MTTYEWINVGLQALIAGGAFVALFVYLIQKHAELRTAATLIVEQIDQISETVQQLKKPEYSGNLGIFKQPLILSENLWDKYKVLFIKSMRPAQVRLIDEFYRNAEEINKGAKAIRDAMLIAWQYRSLAQQLGIGCLTKEYSDEFTSDKPFIRKTDIHEIPPELCSKINVFSSLICKCGDLFTAGLPQDVYDTNLNAFTSIKGSRAYEYLDKKSFRGTFKLFK